MADDNEFLSFSEARAALEERQSELSTDDTTDDDATSEELDQDDASKADSDDDGKDGDDSDDDKADDDESDKDESENDKSDKDKSKKDKADKSEDDEDSDKSEDDKTEDGKKQTPRSQRFKTQAEQATAFNSLASEFEDIGGVEGLKAAGEFWRMLNDTEKHGDLVETINALPPTVRDSAVSEVFWSALDNPANRIEAFNDVLAQNGVPESALLSSYDDLDTVLKYVGLNLKIDAKDFLAEMREDIARIEKYKDQPDDADTKKQPEKTEKKQQEQTENDPFLSFGEEVKLWGEFTDEIFDQEVMPEIRRRGLTPFQNDTAEWKAAKERMTRLIKLGVNAEVATTKAGQAAQSSIRQLTDKTRTKKNLALDSTRTRFSDEEYTAAEKILEDLKPLLINVGKGKIKSKKATETETEVNDTSDDLITKQKDAKSSIKVEEKQEIDYRNEKDPFRARLNQLKKTRS